MSSIISIGNLPSVSPLGNPSTATPPGILASVPHHVDSDSVELSTLGEALSQATGLSSLSVARVRAMRAEIANGTFESAERINGTAARLLDLIR